MKTRQIKYIEPEEDTLEQEVNWAANLVWNSVLQNIVSTSSVIMR
jgi:hypothetical protein